MWWMFANSVMKKSMLYNLLDENALNNLNRFSFFKYNKVFTAGVRIWIREDSDRIRNYVLSLDLNPYSDLDMRVSGAFVRIPY